MEDNTFVNNEHSMSDNGSYNSYYDFYFNYEETKLEIALKMFEAAFLVPVGVIGNVLVFCVLCNKKYHKSSTAIFLSSLSVSDTLILLTGLYNIMVLSNESNIDCKIAIPIWLSSSQTSSCILATVAIERAVNVMQPHKAKFVFTARNAKLLMVIESFVVYGLNAMLLVKYELEDENVFERMFCPVGDTIVSSIIHVYPWVDFCIGFAIPFTVIVVCSTIILIKIKLGKIKQKKQSSKMSSVTKTLLSANVCFLVTLAPSRIFNIIYPLPLLDGVGFPVFLVLSSVSQVNAAVNFFVYFLNAKIFREEIKCLLCRIPLESTRK